MKDKIWMGLGIIAFLVSVLLAGVMGEIAFGEWGGILALILCWFFIMVGRFSKEMEV